MLITAAGPTHDLNSPTPAVVTSHSLRTACYVLPGSVHYLSKPLNPISNAHRPPPPRLLPSSPPLSSLLTQAPPPQPAPHPRSLRPPAHAPRITTTPEILAARYQSSPTAARNDLDFHFIILYSI